MRSTLNPSNLKVIKSSKRKGVFLLVFSLMLVAMGASMVRDGHAFGYRAFGWFVCAFFALGVPRGNYGGVGGAIPDQFIQSPGEVCAALVEWPRRVGHGPTR
jgi:hypothetical protein